MSPEQTTSQSPLATTEPPKELLCAIVVHPPLASWRLQASDAFPDICSMAMKSSCEFALVCVEYSLRLFNAFDGNHEKELKRLREEMLLSAHAIWKGHEPPSSL